MMRDPEKKERWDDDEKKWDEEEGAPWEDDPEEPSPEPPKQPGGDPRTSAIVDASMRSVVVRVGFMWSQLRELMGASTEAC